MSTAEVVLLHGSPASGDEPDDVWQCRLLDLVAVYHRRDDQPAIRDPQVPTHPGPVEDSADEVLRRCGWSPTGP